MTFVPEETYRTFIETMPLLCVDCAIVNKEGQYLLVKRKFEPLKGHWWVPGGRVYKGESMEEAIKRKIRDELGIEIKLTHALGYYEDRFDANPLNLDTILHTMGILFRAEPLGLDIKLDDTIDEWKFADSLPERLVVKPFGVIPT